MCLNQKTCRPLSDAAKCKNAKKSQRFFPWHLFCNKCKSDINLILCSRIHVWVLAPLGCEKAFFRGGGQNQWMSGAEKAAYRMKTSDAWRGNTYTEAKIMCIIALKHLKQAALPAIIQVWMLFVVTEEAEAVCWKCKHYLQNAKWFEIP